MEAQQTEMCDTNVGFLIQINIESGLVGKYLISKDILTKKN